MVLDGRNRLRACTATEPVTEPVIETFTGTEAEALALFIDLNVHRRHLSETRRGLVAARLANMPEGRPRENRLNLDGISNADAGDMFGIERLADAKAKPGLIERIRRSLSGHAPMRRR